MIIGKSKELLEELRRTNYKTKNITRGKVEI